MVDWGTDHIDPDDPPDGWGVPPVQHGERWHLAEFLAEMQLYGHDSTDIAHKDTGLAPERWSKANFGCVWGQLGFLWEYRPDWHLAQATDDQRMLVAELIELRKLLQAGAGAMLGELTALGAMLLPMVDRFWEFQQQEHLKKSQKKKGS
jgi:hypothetical protein